MQQSPSSAMFYSLSHIEDLHVCQLVDSCWTLSSAVSLPMLVPTLTEEKEDAATLINCPFHMEMNSIFPCEMFDL